MDVVVLNDSASSLCLGADEGQDGGRFVCQGGTLSSPDRTAPSCALARVAVVGPLSAPMNVVVLDDSASSLCLGADEGQDGGRFVCQGVTLSSPDRTALSCALASRL